MARRGTTLARLVNLREGHGRHTDILPPRLHEALPEGPLKERIVTPEEVDTIVRDYYLLQGWDPDSGVPSADTLRTLDLPRRIKQKAQCRGAHDRRIASARFCSPLRSDC